MSESKHTPGPWDWLNSDIGQDGTLVGRRGENVIHHDAYEGMWFATHDEHRDAANARLIAAAPDLLEALQELYALDTHQGNHGTCWLHPHTAEKVRAAITKATGGSDG